MSETFSLKTCAAKLGVHYMTAYRYVRLGMLQAEKVGAEWRVDVADFDAFRRSQQSGSKPGRGGEAAPWSSRLEARLSAGDERGSWQVVEAAMASGVEPDRVYTDVLAPAMRSIGRNWEDGTATIADEHRATAIASRIVGRLSARFTRRGRDRGRIVIGTAAGDRHALPVAMVADMFRGAGFEVIDLGSDLPIDAFVGAARAASPVTAVAISVSNTDVLAGVADLTAALRNEIGAPIVIGGHAIEGEDHVRRLGGDAYGSDGRAAVDFAAGIVSG